MFFQHDFEKFVVGRIVLGDQQGWLPGIRTGRLRGALNGFGCRTGCGDASGGQPEPERRSFSIHGSDADLAAQPFDDALADGKTQSGAFCFCVELDEPPEYVVYFVGRDAATGIFHVKIPTVVRQLAVAEMDMALPVNFAALLMKLCITCDKRPGRCGSCSPACVPYRQLLWPDRIFSCGRYVLIPP